jgi:hypothetical protein
MDFYDNSIPPNLIGTERHAIVPDAIQTWADASGKVLAEVRNGGSMTLFAGEGVRVELDPKGAIYAVNVSFPDGTIRSYNSFQKLTLDDRPKCVQVIGAQCAGSIQDANGKRNQFNLNGITYWVAGLLKSVTHPDKTVTLYERGIGYTVTVELDVDGNPTSAVKTSFPEGQVLETYPGARLHKVGLGAEGCDAPGGETMACWATSIALPPEGWVQIALQTEKVYEANGSWSVRTWGIFYEPADPVQPMIQASIAADFGLTAEQVADYFKQGLIKIEEGGPIAITLEGFTTKTVIMDPKVLADHAVALVDPLGLSSLPNKIEYRFDAGNNLVQAAFFLEQGTKSYNLYFENTQLISVAIAVNDEKIQALSFNYPDLSIPEVTPISVDIQYLDGSQGSVARRMVEMARDTSGKIFINKITDYAATPADQVMATSYFGGADGDIENYILRTGPEGEQLSEIFLFPDNGIATLNIPPNGPSKMVGYFSNTTLAEILSEAARFELENSAPVIETPTVAAQTNQATVSVSISNVPDGGKVTLLNENTGEVLDMTFNSTTGLYEITLNGLQPATEYFYTIAVLTQAADRQLAAREGSFTTSENLVSATALREAERALGLSTNSIDKGISNADGSEIIFKDVSGAIVGRHVLNSAQDIDKWYVMNPNTGAMDHLVQETILNTSSNVIQRASDPALLGYPSTIGRAVIKYPKPSQTPNVISDTAYYWPNSNTIVGYSKVVRDSAYTHELWNDRNGVNFRTDRSDGAKFYFSYTTGTEASTTTIEINKDGVLVSAKKVYVNSVKPQETFEQLEYREAASDPMDKLVLYKKAIGANKFAYFLGAPQGTATAAQIAEANSILQPYGAAAIVTGMTAAAAGGGTEVKFYSDAAKTQQAGLHVFNTTTGTDEWYKVDPATGVKTLVQRSASAAEIVEAQGIIEGAAKGIMKSAIGTAGTHIVSFLNTNGGLVGQHVYTTADPLGYWSVGSSPDNQALARQYLTTTAAATDSAQPWQITDAENFLRGLGYKTIQIIKAVQDTRPSVVDGIVYTRFYDTNNNLVCLKAEGNNVNGDPIASFIKTIGWNSNTLNGLIQVVGEPANVAAVTDSGFLSKAATMLYKDTFDRAVKITSYTKTLGNLPAGGYGDIVLFYKGNTLVGRYVQNEVGDDTDDTWEVVTGGLIKQTTIIQAKAPISLLGSNTDILGTTTVKALVRYPNPTLNASYPSEQWRKDSPTQTPEYNRMIEYYDPIGTPLGWRKLAIATGTDNEVTAVSLDNWYGPDGNLLRRLATSAEIDGAKAALAGASGTTIGYVDAVPSLIGGSKTAKFFSSVSGYMSDQNMTIMKSFKEAGNLDKDGNDYDDLTGLPLVSWSIVPSSTGNAAMDLLVRQSTGRLTTFTGGTGYVKSITYTAGSDAETVGVLTNALGGGGTTAPTVTVTGKYVIVMQDYPDAAKTQEITLFYNGTQLIARKISKDPAETLDDSWYYVKPDRTEVLVRGEIVRGQGSALWSGEVDDADWFFRTGIGGYQVKKGVAWFSLAADETRLYFFKQNYDTQTKKYYYAPLAAHQITATTDRWGTALDAAPNFSLKAITWGTNPPVVQTSGTDIETAKKMFVNFNITRSVTVTYGTMVTTIFYNDNAAQPIGRSVGGHTVSTVDTNMNFWNPRVGAGDLNSARLLTAAELASQDLTHIFPGLSVAWARTYWIANTQNPHQYRTDYYNSSNQLIGYNAGISNTPAAAVYTNTWYLIRAGQTDLRIVMPFDMTSTVGKMSQIIFGSSNIVGYVVDLPPAELSSVSATYANYIYLMDPANPGKPLGLYASKRGAAFGDWYSFDVNGKLQKASEVSAAYQNSMATAILKGVTDGASLTSETVRMPWNATATTPVSQGVTVDINGKKTQIYFNSANTMLGYAVGQNGTPYYYDWYKADGTYCQANREYNSNTFPAIQSYYAERGISIAGGITLKVGTTKADYFFDSAGNVVGKLTYTVVNGILRNVYWKWDTVQGKWVAA